MDPFLFFPKGILMSYLVKNVSIIFSINRFKDLNSKKKLISDLT